MEESLWELRGSWAYSLEQKSGRINRGSCHLELDGGDLRVWRRQEGLSGTREQGELTLSSGVMREVLGNA